MVRASDFGPIGRGSIPASGCHRMQIGQNAFVTSLPLSTQERAWHDWVVGLGNACVSVSRGRTLMRRAWLPASHMCMKANDGKTVSALSCKRYIKTDFTFFFTFDKTTPQIALNITRYSSACAKQGKCLPSNVPWISAIFQISAIFTHAKYFGQAFKI